MKKYSISERRCFLEGFETGREDYFWCRGGASKKLECIRTRRELLKLCKKRKDLYGISFQKGYLAYFAKKGVK